MSKRFEVCPSCGGTGTTTAHVEPDGGGFTASEWANEDQGFIRDYLAGVYDRPCETCKGLRVVERSDEPCLMWAHGDCPKEECECFDAEPCGICEECLRADAEYAAEREAERRAGC